MRKFDSQQVMNGTWGEVWINDSYMAQILEFKAEASLKKSEINIAMDYASHYKVTGVEYKGSMKLNKVSSFFIDLMADNIKSGRQTVCTIIASISDPDAIGSERIMIKDATFDSLTLMDWAAKKNGEESYNFTFSDFEYLDRASE